MFLYICDDVANLNYTLNLLKKNISNENSLIIIYLDDPTDKDLLGCSHIEKDFDNLLISYRKFKTGRIDAHNRVPIAYGFLFKPDFLVWINDSNIEQISDIQLIKSSINSQNDIYLASNFIHQNIEPESSIINKYSINKISHYDLSCLLVFYRYSLLRRIGLFPSSIYPENLLLLRLNAFSEIKVSDSKTKQEIKKLNLVVDESYLRYIDRHADQSYIHEFLNVYTSAAFKRCIKNFDIVESTKIEEYDLEHREKFKDLLTVIRQL